MHHRPRPKFRRRGRRTSESPRPKWRLSLLTAFIAILGLGAYPAVKYMDVLNDTGEPMSFSQTIPDGVPGPPQPAAADPSVRMPTGPRAQFRTASTLSDGTKIGVTTLHGKKSGFTGDVWVWAPKEYYEDRYRSSAFPVLLALPGSYGYPTNYWTGPDLKLQRTISDLVAQGRSKPFIVAMPVLNPGKRYYDGSDIPGQPKMGTWISDDVPDLVKANFRTFTSRDGWAIMGSSSGGFVGLKQVLQHPDRFKAVIASGPDTRPDSPLWRGHEKEKRANDPERLARQLAARPGAPDVYLQFQIGTRESGRANLERFIRQYAKGPVKAHLHVIEDGGHDAKSYIRGMRDASLEAISKVLSGPTPSP
ncbi:alpha/beta hydrolase [Streptomyces sp. GS7]|uniref:alpha/beta hydrolase n=1 Tax=Streptomyces sp. GS7 TaxID=2692234 RepID=UPI001317A0E8|nr:alpha/beta fold hydrolase [Streptomyces sp. GS7]QHC20369.1 prolyl oligopeptidase family serine peptidase [Streptomyces sp. GS7]